MAISDVLDQADWYELQSSQSCPEVAQSCNFNHSESAFSIDVGPTSFSWMQQQGLKPGSF
jgi:hypothetical protein